MTIALALRYPFQGQGWFRRLLLLALVQLIPVVGQSILIGYGMEVVRSIYAGQIDLPPIRVFQMFRDGLRFLIAGLLYIVPILGVVPMILTAGSSLAGGGGGTSNIVGILFSIGFVLVVAPMLRRLPMRRRSVRLLMTGVIAAVSIMFIVSTMVSLVNSQPNFTTTGMTLDGVSLLLLVAFSLFIFLIVIGLHVGGMRYAIENRGLFDPTGNARLLLKHRAASAALILNIIVLGVLAIVATGLGLVLLILPGLFALVVCTLALWYLLAHFGIEVGAKTAA